MERKIEDLTLEELVSETIGQPGPQGERGLTGDPGDVGPPGELGRPGVAGPAGPAGSTGGTGPAGAKGDVGPAGVQGLKGDRGDTGPPGLQGVPGVKGDTGPTGPTGPAGPAGPAGALPVVKKAADQAIGVAALTDVADLAIPLGAGAVVCFDFLLIYQTAALTTGIQFGVSGPAGVVEFTALIEIATSLATLNVTQLTALGAGQLTTAVDAANTRRVARIRGAVVNGPNAGTLQVQARSEVAGSAVTVKRGSYGFYA